MAFLVLDEKTLFVATSKGVFTFNRSDIEGPCEPSTSKTVCALPASCQVLATGFQAGEEPLLAIATDDKCVRVYDVSAETLKYCRKVNKQATALAFVDSDSLLVADRVGEVTRLASSGSEPLLGHCSMLLDMILTKKRDFLITADRDDKIRISHYPNAYNIQSFCLGHTDYVRSLTWLQDGSGNDFLASSSGDETVRIWDIVKGECLHVIHLRSILERLKPGFTLEAAECRLFSADHTLAVAYLRFVVILNLDLSQWKVTSEQCLPSDGEILDLSFDDINRLMLLQRLSGVALKMFRRLCAEEAFEEYADSFSVTVNGDFMLREALQESSHVRLPLKKLGSLAACGDRGSKRARTDSDADG